MKKLSRFLSVLVFMVTTTSAEAFEAGQTIRLVNRGKSVLVKNSSLDENENAVLWTETNVNSQRWTLSTKDDNTFFLTNDYTGLYLASLTSATSGTVGQTSRTAASSRGSWEFVPVEGTANQYYIYLNKTRRYALAAAVDATEGSNLTIVNTAASTSINPERITWTVEVVEPMAKEFTKDKRDDMMEKWKARAYKQAGTGWVIGNGGWWGDAEMFEIVLDALETTGDQQYATMFENLYTNFIARNKGTWYQQGVSGYNEYNDDIAWMCIACIRAYLLTGVAKYRTTAKTNFDGMFRRADCYGNDLLQWKHSSTSKGTNSCINGPAAVCACYLAIAQADDSYYEKARKTYLAERNTLFEMSNGKPTGKVWDSYDQGSKTYNYWASTYNQGTCLGAAIMLYNHYGDQMFKDDADAIIKWSEANMANSKGIIHVCQTVNGDLTNFKGIMLRYIRKYAEDFNAPQHYDWIAKNANHAWNNRNSSGITSSAWLTKAEEDFKHLEGSEYKSFGNDGNMTCVSAAFNCHLGAVDSHDAYAQNQAEDFNYVRNAPVVYSGNGDDDGGMVGGMKNNNYIGYRRVDFGTKAASHIDMRLQITLGATSVNVYLDHPDTKTGTLLCSIKGSELTALRTWDTMRKVINQPVTGVHDIYFVSSGTGQTSVNWWQFQSFNPVYADLTNGGGKVTTSLDAEGIEALVDDDLTTAFTANIEAGTETWVQYQSPSPMRIYGYQLFSGSIENGDARGWSLQASDDGEKWETLHTESDTTFSVRGERYFAEVPTTRDYTFYRLLFDSDDGQTQFSLSEWQLLGRCIDDYDLTASIETISDGYDALVDHIGETAFTAPITTTVKTAGNNALTAYSITVNAASKAPTSWKLEGLSTGTVWKVVDQQTDAVFPYDNCTNVYRVNSGTPYLYYRLTVSEEGSEITQWQLFGTPDYGASYADITEISSVKTSDGSDASALVDNDGATYSTISGDNLYWDIRTPLPVKLLGYSLVSADDAGLDPQNIIMYGIDDDGTETQISTKVLAFLSRGWRLTYTTSTTKLFRQFRLQVTESASSCVRLAELELYGAAIAEAEDLCFTAPASVDATAIGLASTELIGRINDGSRTTCYHADFTEPVSIFVNYDQPVRINAYGITASKSEPTRDPADWMLEGDNGDGTWTLLDCRSAQSFSQRYATQFYWMEEAGLYERYRLTVTATGGASQIQIGELQLLCFDDDETAIRTTAETSPRLRDDGVYDISGRRVSDGKTDGLRRGIYIIGGRKVVK